MIIALDFDGTYTADPELWDLFIEKAKQRGHEVICATMRYEHEGEYVRQCLEGKVNQIIFTSRKAKKDFVTRVYKRPTIWIDDNPDWLYEDAT